MLRTPTRNLCSAMPFSLSNLQRELESINHGIVNTSRYLPAPAICDFGEESQLVRAEARTHMNHSAVLDLVGMRFTPHLAGGYEFRQQGIPIAVFLVKFGWFSARYGAPILRSDFPAQSPGNRQGAGLCHPRFESRNRSNPCWLRSPIRSDT